MYPSFYLYLLEHTNNISVFFCLVTHCDVCVCEQYSLWRLPPWVTCGVSRFSSSASKNSSCSSVMANAEMKAAWLLSTLF